MNSEINILFQNEQIIMVDKPNNVLVHHSYYARNIEDDSLLQLLEQQGLGKLYPINRLDRKTSGIILLSKNKESVSEYQLLFNENKIKKTYLALVRGHVLSAGTIDSPVKNERGNYKEAVSNYRPLKLYDLNIPVKPFPTSRYTLLEFQPVTGRTHQLRIHANKIAHPIVGDHKYGNRHHNSMFENQLKMPNLFLHSTQLSFEDPFSKELININCQPPQFWREFEQLPELTITVSPV